jgi:hypothetical protein
MNGPILIEMKRQLISIIDNWHKECYCVNLERNSKAIKYYYIDHWCTNRIIVTAMFYVREYLHVVWIHGG